MTKAFLRIYFRADARLGPGKIRLLELVGEAASISEAARRMGNMSYRRAWLMMRSLNTMFSQPVLETSHGGRGGGGAVLTPFGVELARRFRIFEAKVAADAAREFADLEAALSAHHISELPPAEPTVRTNRPDRLPVRDRRPRSPKR